MYPWVLPYYIKICLHILKTIFNATILYNSMFYEFQDMTEKYMSMGSWHTNAKNLCFIPYKVTSYMIR